LTRDTAKRRGGRPTPADERRLKFFIPMSAREMELRGWDALDFLCVVGDAYVDHPSFGIAIISRLIESMGYRVGIVSQPDWRSTEDFIVMGRPKLGVMVSAGNLDSMLSNYSSPGKRRAVDDYSPSGRPKRRPDRATIVYCNRVRELWDDIPLVIGGIEASLRRMAHYDYWSDEIRRSILTDSRADLLIYGMAERSLEIVARRLSLGEPVADIRDVPGTCRKTHDIADIGCKNGFVEIPSFADVSDDKKKFAEAFKTFYAEQNFASGRAVAQDQGAWTVVQNPPSPPLSAKSLDAIYSLPYMRAPHPSYVGEEIPAFGEARFSITSHRGCFGECSFCAISTHQGRVVQARSMSSILAEAEILTKDPDFKGYIHDIGGPTANFSAPSCEKSVHNGACAGKSCVFPKFCDKLKVSHDEYKNILRRVASLDGVKKVFVRSGLRMDYILADPHGREFLEELCRSHVSGQLKIAPEHASPEVLRLMRKSPPEVTVKFIKMFREINERLGKKQFLVPYFMSSHPGCGVDDALKLAEFMRRHNLRPEQAQEFTPTPGTVSSCMYHTGIDPLTGEKVRAPKDSEERALQRALLQYWTPKNKVRISSKI
jgi:uncharacterized radical SAM protein YgiQ